MATKYGARFPDDSDDLDIEFKCIRYGGRWKSPLTGQECGKGLFFHYKQAMTLMWPEDDWHRWAELGLREMIANRMTTLLGSASSGKTYGASKFVLLDYLVAPETTLVLVSSTEGRGLELRIWGQIKGLHSRAKARFSWLPGKIIDYMKCISTDDLEKTKGKNEGRILNRGLICIPCKSGGITVGMSAYCGAKQKRVRMVADELQFMPEGFLHAISNLGVNPDFKLIALGNPTDPTDELGVAAEPKGGWTLHPEPTKTTVWDTNWPEGRCVNFVGTDSPNFDYSQNRPPKYDYLISWLHIDRVAAMFGKDSAAFYQQCIGVMKSGMLNRRVITKDLCIAHHALEKAIWKNSDRTRVYANDAAYSGVGGDRCVVGWGEFGEAATGEQIIRINPPIIVPISIASAKSPEDQIAERVRDDCESLGIDPDHIFYDSTGRGTLGTAFAKVFHPKKKFPVPVEFGGSPSRRPVRFDLFITDHDNHQKRHLRCDEHFDRKVSELWMESRYVIECDQMRELPPEVMEEGCQREYGMTRGNKTFVESKHDPRARERMKISPDLYDWLVTLIEGARQLGFEIRKVGTPLVELFNEDDEWAQRENDKFRNLIASKLPRRGESHALPWAA